MAREGNTNLGIEAVRAIAEALEPLDEKTRKRVLTSALALLDMGLPPMGPPTGDSLQPTGELTGDIPVVDSATGTSVEAGQPAQIDIKMLRENKQPSTDIEMATLVAYYVSEVAPEKHRKDSINAEDLETYFKQAGHKLPANAGQTLRNAKNAGYLESAGVGSFKLNPVGHNLIVHSLPRAERDPSKGDRRRKKSHGAANKADKKSAKKTDKKDKGPKTSEK